MVQINKPKRSRKLFNHLMILIDGASAAKAKYGLETITEGARTFSEEYGPLFDTVTLMLYDYAMGFFEGSEDDLIDYLKAYEAEDEDRLIELQGEIE